MPTAAPWPVLQDGKPVGLLTDRDVALALAEHGGDLANLPVSDLMTQGVVAVAPEDGLEAIAAKFADKGVRRLLVIDAQGTTLRHHRLVRPRRLLPKAANRPARFGRHPAPLTTDIKFMTTNLKPPVRDFGFVPRGRL